MFRRRASEEPEAPSAPPALDDRARLHAMFDAHHQLVWRTLRRYGLDAESAADVVQQAYVVAVERVADIWPGSERAFLIGTALRLARAAGRKASRLSLDDKLDEQQPQRTSQPEAQAATLELLDKVLGQLEPSLIEVFVLFDVEGFSAREVAYVAKLVEEHLRPVQLAAAGEAPSRRAIYRFYRALGDAVPAVLFLALADAAASRFRAGQVWAIHAPATQPDARLTILRVESWPKLDTVVHIAISNVAYGNGQTAIGHLPFALPAIERSVTALQCESGPIPDFAEGYGQWREAFDRGQAGVFTITVAEAIDLALGIVRDRT